MTTRQAYLHEFAYEARRFYVASMLDGYRDEYDTDQIIRVAEVLTCDLMTKLRDEQEAFVAAATVKNEERVISKAEKYATGLELRIQALTGALEQLGYRVDHKDNEMQVVEMQRDDVPRTVTKGDSARASLQSAKEQMDSARQR